MFGSSLSPICSPCGHVMQPVGPRTVWERQIGGEAASFWPGTEYECVSCRTRTVLVSGHAFTPGSVGHAALSGEAEERERIPAKRFVCGEHLPADVRRDSHRMGGTRHLSQRQQAVGLIEDFFQKDDVSALATLLAVAETLGLDVDAQLTALADAALGDATNGVELVARDAEGNPPRFESFPGLNGHGYDEIEEGAC